MNNSIYTTADVQGLLAQLDQLRQERLTLLEQLAVSQQHQQEESTPAMANGRLSASLLHDLRGSLGVAQHHVPETEREAANSSASIVAQQLAFCQLTLRNWELLSSAVQPQPEWVDLQTAVTPVLTLLARKLHHIQPTLEIPAQLPPLWIDPHQLQQLLFVLLKNGAEAMPDGGRLWILAEGKNGRLQLQIRDEGVGLTAEQRQRLFGEEPQGTGVGLLVARRILQLSGGRLSATSRLGAGTTVRLSWEQRQG